MTLGATSKFVVDNALKCERCFTRSSLPKHKSLRIVPNLSRGGTCMTEYFIILMVYY